MTDDEKMELRRDNEWVLRDLGYLPDVPHLPRRVDFSLVFIDVIARAQAKPKVMNLGFGWDDKVGAVKAGTVEAIAYTMLSPVVLEITDCEIALVECLAPLDAFVDGWGFWGNTVH